MRDPQKLAEYYAKYKPEKKAKKYIVFGVDIESDPFEQGKSPNFRFGCVYGEKDKFVFTHPKLFWKFVKELNFSCVFAFYNLSFDFWFLEKYMPEFEDVNVQYLSRPSFVIIRKTNKYGRKIQILMVDIANFVLRKPLKELAKIFCPDVPKLDFDVTSEENHSNNRKAVEYCMRDAEIVYRIQKLIMETFGYGFSISQIAGRWLKKIMQIDNSGRSEEVKKAEIESYYGGRCDIFKFVENVPAVIVDVNSLYPTAMCNPLPRRFLTELTPEEVLDFLPTDNWRFGYLCHAHVRFKREQKYGFLPYRLQKIVLYPVGEFEGWFWSFELYFLEEHGLIEEYKIDRVLVYELTSAQKDAIMEKYEERKKYKETNPSLSNLIKLFLNSSYGKFAQKKRESLSFTYKEFEEKFHIPVSVIASQTYDGEEIERIDVEYKGKLWKVELYGGCVQLERKLEEEYSGGFTALSSFITARARVYMYKQLLELERNNCQVYAMDTDSFTAAPEVKKILENRISDNLGDFKIENEGVYTVFAPKIYFIKNGERVTEKKKGVPDNRLSQTRKVTATREHIVYQYRKLLKPREARRRKLQPYSLIEETKEVRGYTYYSKGYVLADGTVQPLELHIRKVVKKNCTNFEWLEKEYECVENV